MNELAETDSLGWFKWRGNKSHLVLAWTSLLHLNMVTELCDISRAHFRETEQRLFARVLGGWADQNAIDDHGGGGGGGGGDDGADVDAPTINSLREDGYGGLFASIWK